VAGGIPCQPLTICGEFSGAPRGGRGPCCGASGCGFGRRGGANERAWCAQPPTLSKHGGHRPADAVQLLLGHSLVDRATRAEGLAMRGMPPARSSEPRAGALGAGAGAEGTALVGGRPGAEGEGAPTPRLGRLARAVSNSLAAVSFWRRPLYRQGRAGGAVARTPNPPGRVPTDHEGPLRRLGAGAQRREPTSPPYGPCSR
jgi:hypothetical protein